VDRWLSALAIVFAAVILAAMGASRQSLLTTVLWLLALAVLSWWVWPGRQGTHISHAEAQDQADDDDVIVYWRPG